MEVGEHDSLVGERGRSGFFSRFKYPLIAVVIVVLALAVVAVVLLTARSDKGSKAWEDLVQVNNMMGHLQELQKIANASGNTRASNTIGYNRSVEYVLQQLQDHTPYHVKVQNFTYPRVNITAVSNMTIQTTTSTFPLVVGKDFAVIGSASGTQTITNATYTQVNSYGCDAADYPETVKGTIALVKRGVCTFDAKIGMAASFNPTGIIVFNEGNTPDRTGLFNYDMGLSTVPTFSASFFAAQLLTQTATATISVEVTVLEYSAYAMNVIAETPVGRADRVIIVGSHLDSVPAGPGINDNGSGSSLNLELALQVAKEENQKKIENKIRFCWWGAEELGLLGSKHYVYDLQANNATALSEIALNLNFDMVGSPNFVRGVYNGSSDSNVGSAVIQREFKKFFAGLKLPVEDSAFTGRSDYGPFLNASLPAGGLDTGAEVIKTAEERSIYGGFAGAAFDPCYHQACDTVDNINQVVYSEMGKAAAHVLETLATQEDLQTFLKTL